jgi:hypothetical protein
MMSHVCVALSDLDFSSDDSSISEEDEKKFQKMMSDVCVAFSDLDFSSDDSSSSEEDEKPKRKIGDFTPM